MTVRGAADVAFFQVGGFELLGSVTNFTDKSEAVLVESHALGDAWKEQTFAGVRAAEITQDGFYDDAVDGAHAALSTGPGVGRVLVYGLEGTATGAGVVCWSNAMEVNYQRIAARDDLVRAKAVYRSNGPVESGKLLRTYKPTGASGATTGGSSGVDNGASTPAYTTAVAVGGGAGYFSWNATANVEGNFRILDSADNLTFATLLTFTKTTSGGTSTAPVRGAERLTTTGAIQRYTAVDYTTASATGGTGISYLMALVRGLTT